MQFGEAWKRGLIPTEELLGSFSPFDDPRVAGIKAIAWQRCKDG